MNAWQIVQQIQYLLRLAEWTTNVPVFASGSVACTEAIPEKAFEEMQPPTALISVGGQEPDPEFREDMRLRKQQVNVLLAQQVENDRLGESTLIGAARTSGSDGRGILEVEEKLELAISELTKANGVRVAFFGGSGLEARQLGASYRLAREYVFDAWLSTARAYQPATQMKAVVAQDTRTIVTTWKYPGLRFDTRRAILRRVAGSSAPTGPTDGVGVVLGGAPDGQNIVTATQVNVSAGTYSYGVFIAYDETGSGTDEKYSPVCSVTGVVVN